MSDNERKTIISLFAHPDDELSALGTLANHAARGDRVVMAWTTYGELTTLFDNKSIEDVKEERKKHAQKVADIIGAEKTVFLDLGDTYVENTRDQRVKVAKLYVEERPNAVISWGLHNSHSDHRNTGYLALEAIKFARINRVVNTDDPHRENVKLLQYYEEGSQFPVKYIQLEEGSLEKAKQCAEYYAEIYDWENVHRWAVDRRKAWGVEANTEWAEKYNVRFEFDKPPKYVV